MKIFDKIGEWYTQKKPFVVFREPNTVQLKSYFVASIELSYTTSYTKEGFVFAPFDEKKPTVFFSKEQSAFLIEDFSETENNQENKRFDADENQKKSHLNLVEKALDAIQQQKFKKVVLSRKELVELNDFDLTLLFKKLLKSYKNAFVYVWFHPKIGLWLGATPETLVKISDTSFETMSLAGTQEFKINQQPNWKAKELYEQQLVTDYIVEKLTPIVKELTADAVTTIKAGNLLHLKTKITGVLGNNRQELVSCLHPTPAICGYPKEPAFDFIIENENYDRTFYAGFLGEITTEKLAFYVNLRCMQLVKNTAKIYVGGGITADSLPTKEWNETVAKATTIKRIL